MTSWELPTELEVGGEYWHIKSDFRDILGILMCFNDPEFADVAPEVCLELLYEDYENMPFEMHTEAMQQAIEFIDMGLKDDGTRKPHTMDWEQDATIIIPSVNRVLGKEIRAVEYLHWWTFLGAYMEIGESLFSQVLYIRSKKAKGKKLEKHEQEFYKDNKQLIDLKIHYTDEEKEEQERLKALLG